MNLIKSIRKHTNAIPDKEMPERHFNYYCGVADDVAFLNKNGVYNIEEFLDDVANERREIATYIDLQILDACLSIVERAKPGEQTEVFGHKFDHFMNGVRNKNTRGEDVLL